MLTIQPSAALTCTDCVQEERGADGQTVRQGSSAAAPAPPRPRRPRQNPSSSRDGRADAADVTCAQSLLAPLRLPLSLAGSTPPTPTAAPPLAPAPTPPPLLA